MPSSRGFTVIDSLGQQKTTGMRGETGATGAGGGDLNPETHLATITAPVNGDFSWVNQGSSSIVDDTSSVVLIGAATGSGSNIVARVKTAPSTPYTITAYLTATMFHKATQGYGLCFRESSSGKLHTLFIDAADLGLTVLNLSSYKWTNPTTFSATYLQSKVPAPLRWLRLQDDGTNRILSVGHDGVRFLTFHTIGRTDFLTADQVGFMISTENAATPNSAPILRVQSWRQT